MIAKLLAHKLAAPIAAGLFFLASLAGLTTALFYAGQSAGAQAAAEAAIERADTTARDLSICLANVETMRAGVDRQNASLKQAAAEASDRLAKANAELARVRADNAGLRERITARLNRPPPPPAAQCAEASKLIRDTLAEERP